VDAAGAGQSTGIVETCSPVTHVTHQPELRGGQLTCRVLIDGELEFYEEYTQEDEDWPEDFQAQDPLVIGYRRIKQSNKWLITE
jgi:hypothetical protein